MPELNRTTASHGATRRDLLRWGMASGAVLLGPGLAACESAVDKEDDKNKGGGKGGQLVIAQGADIVTKNVLNQAAPSASWRLAVFDTLIRMDHRTHKVQPHLATEWKTSSDGKVTTFTLRDDVVWHSGRPFEAADVKAAIDFQTEAQPPFAFSWLFKGLGGIEVPDKRTVRLAFKKPADNLFDVLSLMAMTDHETEQELLAGKKLIGTGPFVFDELQQGSSLKLKRNTKYWDSGKPRVDSVLVRIITKPEAKMNALRSGQIHLATDVSALDLKQIEGDKKFTITPYDTYTACIYLGANTGVRLLKDKKVRQAIQYAVDRERINKEVYRGRGRVTASPWSTTSPAHNKELAGRYDRDLDRARRMLKEAGAEGATVVLQSAPPTATTAEIVEFNLREAGLKPKLRVLNAAEVQEHFEHRSFDGLYIAQHGYNNLAPSNLVFSSAPYRTWQNLFRFESKKYASLAQDALQATGDSEQREAYDALTGFMLDEAFCCDLVQATNTTVSRGVIGWDYTVWNDMTLDSATLV